MAVTATVDKFGMTFSEAYHKIARLTYESNDQKTFIYPAPAEPAVDEDGNPIPSTPPMATPPVETWVKKNFCNFEVATYASEETRENHSEPIYRTHFHFEAVVDAEAADIIVQAYSHLKAQAGYEDAVDC
jgi:hypothetical protein